MKYGINKQYIATDNGSGGGNPADAFMSELKNIKSALEANFAKKAAEQDKNFEDKLDLANQTIKSLEEKIKANEATAETVNKLDDELKITIKALDVVQTRMKSQSMKGSGFKGEDESFIGKLQAGIQELKDNIKGDQITGGKFVTKIQLKAVGDMTVTTNVSTGVVPNTYRSGLVTPPFQVGMVHMRDIVSVTPSETDSYHFYRFSIGEGTIEFQTNENTEKAQVDADLTEQTVNLNYLAGWMKISKKMLRNFKSLQATLSKWLPEMYYRREDTKAYQALISAATGVQYTGVAGESIAAVIIKTIGRQKELGYDVNGIVLDGTAWASLLTFQASTSGIYTNPINVVNVSPAGGVSILGIPVYTAAWVGGSEVIIGDWRYFEIIQSEGLSLQFFDQDGDNARYNKITARIEASVGFAVLDPAAFVVQSLDSVS
jgi:HK97 family phage major capsid protein